MPEIHSYTCAGERTSENQDAFEVRAHPEDAGYTLVAVADGQGGREGGALAAWLACQAGIEAACAAQPLSLMQPARWSRILRAADAAVFRRPEAGFTTLVMLCVAPTALCGAANGDSAAVLVNAGETGRILTERQPKNPPVGSGSARSAGFCARLARPWSLLVMSDGVWKYTGWEPIFRIVSEHSGRRMIEGLRRSASLQGSRRLQDDFTLVVVQDSNPA